MMYDLDEARAATRIIIERWHYAEGMDPDTPVPWDRLAVEPGAQIGWLAARHFLRDHFGIHNDGFTASRKSEQKGGRPRGCAPWRPQKKTLVLLDQVKELLVEYNAYLPLTIRQVFYLIVAKHGYPKDDNAYERLGNMLNRARRAKGTPHHIPFSALRDDSSSYMRHEHYDDIDDFHRTIRMMAENFHLNALAPQEVNMRLYCEAAGMIPQLHNVVERYSVPVYSGGGFDSTTNKHDLADAIKGPGRVADHDLPEYEAKGNEHGAPQWRAEGRKTCQLEAVPPDVLANLITASIERHLDDEALMMTWEAIEPSRRLLARQLTAASKIKDEGGGEVVAGRG